MKQILLLIIALTMLPLVEGCKNVPQAAIKTEGVVITTVDVGMKTWARYVNQGKATQDQIDRVHKAYDTYYKAQLVVETALEKYVSGLTKDTANITTANADVAAAQGTLLSLINSFIK